MLDLQDATDLLASPKTKGDLDVSGETISAAEGSYPIKEGIPLFSEQPGSGNSARQMEHYNRVADSYTRNLEYPHTQVYSNYLDRMLLSALPRHSFDTVAEICAGRGDGLRLLKGRYKRAIGLDISFEMLKRIPSDIKESPALFVQGDATELPLSENTFDVVLMIGGVHHVLNRHALFSEIQRVLKPGGIFIFRDPVSDFFLWKWLRAAIYRLSSHLDSKTERPLHQQEIVPLLSECGLPCTRWNTHGLGGFCFLMNSHVLVFNRLFRFIPGIRNLTRGAANLDEWLLRHVPGLENAGLIVVGRADKPENE